MKETRIQISSVVEGQLPEFVREEFPLVSEFLTQYYLSLESLGGTTDILQNIDQYVKIDNLTNLTDSTSLSSDVTFFDSIINVESTYGFVDKYGLLLIDEEIITYTGKTSTSFTGCIRGFSGTTSYQSKTNPDQLVFTETNTNDHSSGSIVRNLSILFLKEFFKKIKKQINPGFSDREFYSGLDERLFVKQSKDFYSTKGTNTSFEILFRALYGKDVEIIKPRDFLIQPSDAQYSITKNLIVEAIEGDPLELQNTTIYQDSTDFFIGARGTVIHVEKITRGYKDYYILNLDYSSTKDINLQGTVFGNFSIHPKTQTTTSVSLNSSILDVDSTIGFPNNGTLIAQLSNGTTLSINYDSKTITQFFNCTNIDQEIPIGQEVALDSYAYAYSGIDRSNIIKVRITGVLSDFEIASGSEYYNKGDLVSIRTLGKDLDGHKANNWLFNIATKFEVSSIQLADSLSYSYQINLYDDHIFFIGDSATLISSDGAEKIADVIFINNKNSFTIKGQGELDTSLYYTVRKNILKANSTNYTSISIYDANVQNVYTDQEKSLYVTAPSIPSYLNQQLQINDRSIVFGGTFNGTDLNFGKFHGFYTGDSVVYSGDIIPNGIYFVYKVNNTTIKIARSRANIYSNNFLTFVGTITSGKFIFSDFCYENLDIQLLEPQKLVRKLSDPQNDSNKYETNPGLTGIFINGVELLNYKSKDNIYYGPIESVQPSSPGFGYDITNPPILTINDYIGTGASAYCSIIGGLERIDIIDPGFDYLEEPVINITGGNGTGAIARTKLVSFDYSINFNSQVNAGLVDLNDNTITFPDYHKFRDVEEVIYVTNGGTAIAGLSTNSSYFISLQDEYTVKLHKSYGDASSKINEINLSNYGIGNHTLRSKDKKKKIGSIFVENSGINYNNKKTTVTSVGIDTAADVVNIKNHGYVSGEIISYTPTSTPIGGLSTSSYYVTVLDKNKFKLSQIGFGTVGGTTENGDFYYQTNQYINLTSGGSGTHIFNYPPINVSISGRIGVSIINPQNFNAVLQPIFRGQIESVFVENGGSSYGSEEIINYDKQPQFLLNSGSGAQVTPLVSNGEIIDVIINSPGYGYNSPPNLNIQGDGIGAILTPILSNGTLISVKIISGGNSYTSEKTNITISSAGKGANFICQIKSWKINLVERLIETGNITDDDGIVDNGIVGKLGLQYTHAYASRNLRKSLLSKSLYNGSFVYSKDLQFTSKEEDSIAHSPILGWAYDGNPIYGPYGYDNPRTGGSIRNMTSGYVLIGNENRPQGYLSGFFVDDYEYQNIGDLDEFNGRFCITPEYPNGIYAYFCTISSIVDPNSSSPFKNYKTPVFPYVIGNYFRSKPIDFNFSASSNQDDFDFKSSKLLRNTTPYNLNKEKSGYDYILNPNKLHPQLSEVKGSTTGSIQSIQTIFGGDGYKVGDSIVFDTINSGGRNVRAKVSSIEGKEISQISIASSSVSNVEFVATGNFGNFIGFATLPHNFSDNDLVTIITPYENKTYSNISIQPNSLNLRDEIGSAQYTGIVTYFNVSGFLEHPNIKENDIYQIENEQIKVLNIDSLNSRIRVLRNYNGTSGLTTYNIGVVLTEKTRKLQLNFGISSTSYEYNLNKEFYFNPKESVGLGITTGVVSTIYFSNPGAGITYINIPSQTIYLPNHKLNTGDSLSYSSNGGNVLSISTNGVSNSFLLNDSIVYVAKISNDLIGISTLQVGLGSTGTFSGIGTISTGLLYFTGIGTGVYHSFVTNYSNTLIGQVSKNIVTVSTSSTTGLSVGDSVIVDIKSGISTTVVISYNDYNRRLVTNPKSFASIDVDIQNGTIKINNHRYTQGQKIIHKSSSPSGGLLNEKIYYIIVIDSDTIKLSETLYSTKKPIPTTVNITSSSFGTIFEINPPINAIKNQTIIFDVSDSSLSFNQNSISYSAFDLNFYTDSKFKNKFDSTSSNSYFEIVRSGFVGISSDAKIVLALNENVPKKLYYRLEPINIQNNTIGKKEIIVDDEQVNHNQLNVVDSAYNGSYRINAISTTGFNYNILQYAEKTSYSFSEGDLKYYTNSSSAYGPIHSIDVTSKGNDFISLPTISSIKTQSGNGAILKTIGVGIGSVIKKEILDIGFDYSSDYTIRPIAKLPTIVKVDPFYSFESIGITSSGKDYYISPDLVVLDGFTDKIVSDIILNYQLGSSQVEILKNTKGIYNVTPRIIPINNSNGVGISSIVFDSVSKNVTATLSVGYSTSTSFPFAVGDRVLIENVSVGGGSTERGYNSDRYNYTLFTLISTDPNIGGNNGTVTYNMTDYLSGDEVPGISDPINSSGRIIPEKYFPKFNPILRTNIFYDGETISSNSSNSKGIVQRLDINSEYLKIATKDVFDIGDILTGNSSFTQGVVIDILSSAECIYDVDSFSISRNGWKKETGFLSNNLQRIHDSDYYQYFSYSLKSEIPIDTWIKPVNDLNHTVGFKKFSDLIIESNNISIGIQTSQDGGDFTAITDLYGFVDLNYVNDYDLARETTINIDNNIKSNEIIFNSLNLQDYIQSVGNRVLTIDDISEEFGTKRSFVLNHRGRPIFETIFNGSDVDVVNTSDNIISIPNHFFVTGEEVTYTYSSTGTTNAIGIATTSIPGIGVTDKLPSTVYIVKSSDIYVKVAASASESLRTIPSVLNISNAGIGTLHKFTSNNQNSKLLITIDNSIQSPIVSTSTTTLTSSGIGTTSSNVDFVNIVAFFAGDLIQISNEIMRINSIGVGTFTNRVDVQRSWMGTAIATHALGSLVKKVIGDYNVVGNTLNFVDAPYGPTPIGTSTNPPDQRDYLGISTYSSFNGRVFLRSAISDSQNKSYYNNYVFDDLSSEFVGLNTQFTLKSNKSNVVGFSTNNAVILINDIFQGPSKFGSVVDYSLVENSGITSITFTGFSSVSVPYDINTKNIPRGGIIVSVGSTSGFGYQPLVAAGGTAVVSTSGTISSISIGNSGSGYRVGVQTMVRVGVTTLGVGEIDIQFIGTAAVSDGRIVSVAITNPGIGYTRSNPPLVIFDSPLSYFNIPLIYSSSSSTGVGTEATVDIIVGQGSSVINFEIKNSGYSYNQGEILTIRTGGTVGIPTNTSLAFKEFRIVVDRTFSDKFTGWSFGDLQVLDPIDSLFDGSKIIFPIKIDKKQTSIQIKKGSNIDIKSNLLVFINDILQVPGKGYFFNGGSTIIFSEAPKFGDRSKLLFYKGTSDVDTVNIDIFETIKVGDNVKINGDSDLLQENERLVTQIISSDVINTNLYSGPGITNDPNLLRPLLWRKQTEDRIIDGQSTTKDREIYEAIIQPSTTLIQNVGISTTVLFVESVKTFFNSTNELNSNNDKIKIISQNSVVSASATSIVASDGTIDSIAILHGGSGYSTPPAVSIASPIGYGISVPMTSYAQGDPIPVGLGTIATFTSSISIGGTVSSVFVVNAGSGYTSSNPPLVIIEPPTPNTEIISKVTYQGDFGMITGIKTTTVGVASTGIVFDLYIPQDSFLRDTTIVGTSVTVSGIQTGYYFIIHNSNVGNGVTSLNFGGSIVGVGSTFLDNIYNVSAVSIAQTTVPGVGTTYVAKVTVSVSGYNGLTGIGSSGLYGEYSWGRISAQYRTNPQTFTIYNNGILGISTSPIVQRYNPLKYQNYIT